MFGIIGGLAKIALSPARGVVEIIKDVSGQNGEDAQGVSILTMGVSSAIKGTAKGIKEGAEDIFED